MSPLFDFKCETHGVFEALEPAGTKTTFCPECGKIAPREGVPVHGGVKINNFGGYSAVKPDSGSYRRGKSKRL